MAATAETCIMARTEQGRTDTGAATAAPDQAQPQQRAVSTASHQRSFSAVFCCLYLVSWKKHSVISTQLSDLLCETGLL